MHLIPFNQLKQGQQFRFEEDAETTVRTAQQIGSTEIYCPIDGANTMGHSMAGGEEVYRKTVKKVIVLDAPIFKTGDTVKAFNSREWSKSGDCDVDNRQFYQDAEILRIYIHRSKIAPNTFDLCADILFKQFPEISKGHFVSGLKHL